MKGQLTLSYRVEMFGTGFYRALTKQYAARKPELARTLSEFADAEYRHGALFKKCFQDIHGKAPAREGTWIGLGACAAGLMKLLPLRLKLKQASLTEILAVKVLEKDLASGAKNPYIDIVKQILPDEKKHAGFYQEWCGKNKK